MGKSSASAPAVPDPYATANAQTQSNNTSAAYNAALNNVNQSGPLGSTSYSISGYDPTTGAPIYTQTQTLNPYSQQALTNQQGNQSAATGLAGNALQNSANVLANPLNPTSINQQASQAAYNNSMALIAPQEQQQTEALQSQMAAQGVTDPRSAAYQQGTDNLARQQAFQNNNLANQATLTGIQAGQTAFGQNLSAQQQALANFQGLNGQQIAMPGSVAPSSSQTAPANVGQLVNNAYQGNLGAYNAQLGQQNSLNSGLFSLGAGALGNSNITSAIGSFIKGL